MISDRGNNFLRRKIIGRKGSVSQQRQRVCTDLSERGWILVQCCRCYSTLLLIVQYAQYAIRCRPPFVPLALLQVEMHGRVH